MNFNGFLEKSIQIKGWHSNDPISLMENMNQFMCLPHNRKEFQKFSRSRLELKLNLLEHGYWKFTSIIHAEHLCRRLLGSFASSFQWHQGTPGTPSIYLLSWWAECGARACQCEKAVVIYKSASVLWHYIFLLKCHPVVLSACCLQQGVPGVICSLFEGEGSKLGRTIDTLLDSVKKLKLEV